MLLLCCCSCCCPSSETKEKRGVSHTRGWKSKRVRDDDERRRRGGERRRSTRPTDEGRGTAPAFSQPPQAVPLRTLSLSKEREKNRVRAQDSVLRCAALPCVRHDHAHGRRRPRRRRAKLGVSLLEVRRPYHQPVSLALDRLCSLVRGGLLPSHLFFSLPNLCRNLVLPFRNFFFFFGVAAPGGEACMEISATPSR